MSPEGNAKAAKNQFDNVVKLKRGKALQACEPEQREPNSRSVNVRLSGEMLDLWSYLETSFPEATATEIVKESLKLRAVVACYQDHIKPLEIEVPRFDVHTQETRFERGDLVSHLGLMKTQLQLERQKTGKGAQKLEVAK